MGADYHGGYASVEKPRNAKPEEAKLVRTCIQLWRPLTAVFFYWNMQCERSDLTGAFLRSLVECGPVTPHPTKGTCPPGSFLQDKACHAAPRGSRNWSGSGRCADKFLVVARATAIGGQMSSCSTICSLVAQIFVGSMLVDTFGRKPVMLMGLTGSTICTLLFLCSCFMQSSAAGLNVMFVGIALFSLSNAFPAAALAMASDLSRNNIVQRGMSYTAIFCIQHVGICTAFVAGYFILALDLTDYREVWAIFLCICAGIVLFCTFLLRETLFSGEGEAETALSSKAPRAEKTWEESNCPGFSVSHGESSRGRFWMQHAVTEVMTAFGLVSQDRFLRYSMFLTFLANVAATGCINITGGYAITVVGLTQAVASLAGVFQPAAIVCGSSCSTWLLMRVGPYNTYFMGISLTAAGMVITGLAATMRSAAEVLFWTGWVIVGIGWGVGMPSHAAFNSIRVPDKNDHGKLFAAIQFVSAIGATLGSLVWTNCIFSGKAVQSWRGGLGYFISAALVVCVVAGYGLLYLMLIRPEERLLAQEKQSP